VENDFKLAAERSKTRYTRHKRAPRPLLSGFFSKLLVQCSVALASRAIRIAGHHEEVEQATDFPKTLRVRNSDDQTVPNGRCVAAAISR
jgi:hypothetical protein